MTASTTMYARQKTGDRNQSGARNANQRLDKHFKNARNHSVFVKLLKGALPVIAIVLVAGFVVTSLRNTGATGEVSVKSSGITNGKLIMESPRVKGFDSQNQPYDLNATRAIQDLKKPDIVTLESIDAILPSKDGNFAKLDARTGIYDSAKEWLSLEQDIVINRKDGTVIKLDSAEIDLKNGNLTSKNPVQVSTPTSRISADGVEVSDSGAIVIFKNRVQMTIQPSKTN